MDRFPLISAAVCTICAFELYCGLHRFLAPRTPVKSYNDGVTDGYAMARAELSRVAERSYTNDGSSIVPREQEQEEPVPEGAVHIDGLARCTLNLLGDKYVIRVSLRADTNKVWWFLTERDSNRMDHMLEELLKEGGGARAPVDK